MTDTSTNNKTAKSEQTKKRIIQTYLKLIDEKKWDKITVKELCLRSDITRGTFYQYYSDIYEMMEQIQNDLLADITLKFQALPEQKPMAFLPEEFIEKYDYAPPQTFLIWFEFCKQNRSSMEALLNQQNGDIYFVHKMKHILNKYINIGMDNDGLPQDEMRSYFVKILSELHFMTARLWLESCDDNFLSIEEIVNLLNTMRVGAGYLTYKKATSEDFDTKMKFHE